MRKSNHKVPTVYTSEVRKRQVHKVEKMTKNNASNISKEQADLQTGEICAEFQKDWYEIV